MNTQKNIIFRKYFGFRSGYFTIFWYMYALALILDYHIKLNHFFPLTHLQLYWDLMSIYSMGFFFFPLLEAYFRVIDKYKKNADLLFFFIVECSFKIESSSLIGMILHQYNDTFPLKNQLFTIFWSFY